MNRLLLFSLQILFYTVSAFAGEATFGPEFNFTNERLIKAGRAAGQGVVDTKANIAAQKQFVDEVERRCSGCVIKKQKDKFGLEAFKVRTPEGWSFAITLDPWVVEVIADGMTSKEIAVRAPRIQYLIFDAARAINLAPQEHGGHIHIGISSGFSRDPLQIRNFVVDWANYSKVMAEAFYFSIHNAAPMEMIQISENETVKDRFIQFIESWDKEFREQSSFLWFSRTEDLIKKFSQGMIDQVYVKSYADWDPPHKYQNINLSHIKGFPREEQTIELRAVREFQSAEHYAEFTRVLQGRIDYLSRIKSLLPVVRSNRRVRPAHKIFDDYIYKSNGSLDYNRDMSSFDKFQFPIEISCESVF